MNLPNNRGKLSHDKLAFHDSYRKRTMVSRPLYEWVFPYILHFCRRKGIRSSEAHIRVEKHRLSESLVDKFEKELSESTSRSGKVNIYKAILAMFKADFAKISVYAVASELSNIVNLFCLRYFFAWIVSPTHTNWHGYAYAILMGCLSVSAQLFKNHANEQCLELGNYIRVAILGTLFKKLERLNQKSFAMVGAGKLVSLASNDMIILERGFVFFYFFIGARFNVMGTMALLWVMFDWVIAAGCFFLYLVIVAVEIYLSRFQAKWTATDSQFSDSRMKQLADVIKGSRTIKAYAWEEAYEKIIGQSRQGSLNVLKKQFSFQVLGTAFFLQGGLVMTIFVFAYTYCRGV